MEHTLEDIPNSTYLGVTISDKPEKDLQKSKAATRVPQEEREIEPPKPKKTHCI